MEKNVANCLYQKQSHHFDFIVYIITFLPDLSRYFTATIRFWTVREKKVVEMLPWENKWC